MVLFWQQLYNKDTFVQSEPAAGAGTRTAAARATAGRATGAAVRASARTDATRAAARAGAARASASTAARASRCRYFFDGFGRIVRSVDHSSAGDITRSLQKSLDQPTGQFVSRATLPYLSGGIIKYLETRFDLRGRPVARNRLDATTAVERQLVTYTYNQDGSITATRCQRAQHANELQSP
jgi:hypothetical protein